MLSARLRKQLYCQCLCPMRNLVNSLIAAGRVAWCPITLLDTAQKNWQHAVVETNERYIKRLSGLQATGKEGIPNSMRSHHGDESGCVLVSNRPVSATPKAGACRVQLLYFSKKLFVNLETWALAG